MLFVKNRLRRLKRFKDDHKALYFFKQTADCINRWGYPVGLSILEESFTPINARLIFLVIFNSVFVIFNINSVMARKNEDMVEVMISCITIGMALQGLVKQYTFLGNYKEVAELIHSGSSFYDILQHDKMKKTARDFAFFGWMVVLHFIRYAYILAVCGCYFIPIIYSHLFMEKRELPFAVEIPLINENTDLGYWINAFYLLISSIYEMVGLVATDSIYLLLLLNGFTQLENIYFELEMLDKLILDKEMHDRPKKISEQLNNIIQLHQKYIR